jgi:AraC family transcriptional regulator
LRDIHQVALRFIPMSRSDLNIHPLQFGDCLWRSEVGGFAYSEKVYSPNLVIPRHIHDEEMVMMMALMGEFIEIRDNSRDECSASGFIFNPAGVAHSNVFGPEGTRCLVIKASALRSRAAREYSSAFDQPLCAPDPLLAALGRRIRQEFQVGDEAAPLAIEGLTLELLAMIARRHEGANARRPPAWLRQARDYLHDCFSERFDLTELARVAGVHPAHLAREFRRHFHCTAGEYLRRLRLDRAVRRLSQSEESIAEIAADVGFYDQSHFSRAVKAHTGLSPAAYREAQRGGKSRTK